MSELKAMAKHSSHYFLAYALSMAAGLISFPIYTRLFSVSDYGLMGLISTSVFFVMALSKLGIQNSIIRFYAEVKNKKSNISLRAFYSTLTFGPIAMVGTVTFVYFIVVFLARNTFSDPGSATFFMMSAVWAFFMCSNTIVLNFLRAEQNTELYNIIMVINKYSALITGVGLVYFVFNSLFGLYLALIVNGGAVFAYLLYRLHKNQNIGIRYFDKGFFKESLSYGFPLMGAELTSIILNAGDRYVILYYMSTAAVGYYSAGYDLAMTVVESLIFPLSFAITPLYMKIYAQKGKDETSLFLSQCLRYFLLIALPCIFGLNHLGKEMTILLASEKFIQSYVVIPYVSWGVLFFGLSNIFNAGLLIQKKSIVITFWTVIAGIGNIALNFLFIPYFGFVGAAIATLLAYLFLFAVLAYKSFAYIPFRIDYINIGKYLIFSLIMLVVLHLIKFDSVVVSIAMKAITGGLVYGLLIVLFDRETFDKLKDYIKKRGALNEIIKVS